MQMSSFKGAGSETSQKICACAVSVLRSVDFRQHFSKTGSKLSLSCDFYLTCSSVLACSNHQLVVKPF